VVIRENRDYMGMWKKSLVLQVIMVMQVHKQFVEVAGCSLETLPQMRLHRRDIFSSNFSNVTEEEGDGVVGEDSDVHAVLAGVVGREGGGEVTGSHNVFDLGIALREVSGEVHFLPTVLLLAFDAGKSESLEGIAVHEVEGSI
jgi:hypothetical protein